MDFIKKIDKEKQKKFFACLLFFIIFNTLTYSTMNTTLANRNKGPDPRRFDQFGLPKNQSQAVYLDIRRMTLNNIENSIKNNSIIDSYYFKMLKHIETNLLNGEYSEWKKFNNFIHEENKIHY